MCNMIIIFLQLLSKSLFYVSNENQFFVSSKICVTQLAQIVNLLLSHERDG